MAWCICEKCGRRHKALDPKDDAENERRYFTCVACQNPCDDIYQVRDHAWREAGMESKPDAGVLHLECLEKRRGTPLTPADFTQAPINGALRFGYLMGKRVRVQARDQGSLVKPVLEVIEKLVAPSFPYNLRERADLEILARAVIDELGKRNIKLVTEP